jgi:RNA polymerase sigma-70 factor (ECF subfamily)
VGVDLSALSDDELLRRFRSGDDAAFGALDDRYRGRVTAYATRLLYTTYAAEDVVHEAFLSAHVTLRRDEQAVRVGPWLHALVHSHCVDRWRVHGSRLAADLNGQARAWA